MLNESTQTQPVYTPHTPTASAVRSDRDPELINKLAAVDHVVEFNRINAAFMHAEPSFCVGSRFCVSPWRRCCGSGNCSADLWNREDREALARVLWFAHPNTAPTNWQHVGSAQFYAEGFLV